MRFDADSLGEVEANRVYGRRGVRRVISAVLTENAYGWLRGMRLVFNASRLGRGLNFGGATCLALLARSGVAAGIYYTLFSREFDREHRAVLAARARHIRDVESGRGNLYMLRRNVHRLEKGLIMKPARPLFGVGKIGETVQAYASCLRQLECGGDDMRTSLEWSKQVLLSYFDRVADHPLVADAKIKFERADATAGIETNVPRVPFPRKKPSGLPSIEQFEALARFRRSVRWFEARPVPREVIDRAVNVAMDSPSACNRQPFRYAFFDAHELVQKVGSVPKGTPGWLHQIPCFAVIVGKFDALRFERDRHVPYIDGCLSAMSLIYALEVQGVSSCCVNFPDFADTEKRMAKALNLPPWERAIMCLAIGYPDMEERVPYSQKLPLEMARKFNDKRS